MTARPPELPTLLEPWIADLLGGPLPGESKATCANCAMVAAPGRVWPPDQPEFAEAVKCCTFYPNLSNFAVGQILADRACAGRAEVERRIVNGPRVSPLGIARPPLYALTYRESASEVFGRVPQLACAFMASGKCSIHPYREATCITYFCKFERGSLSKNFWKEVQWVISAIEQQLAKWAMRELDIGPGATSVVMALREEDKLTNAEVFGSEPAEYKAVRWGKWAGREREFFAEAAALVASLSWSDVEGICGIGMRIHADLMRSAYQALQGSNLPERLRVGEHRSCSIGGGRSLVYGYSNNDGLEVDDSVLAALARFDGTPTDALLAGLASEGKTIATEVIEALFDHQVLVATIGTLRKP